MKNYFKKSYLISLLVITVAIIAIPIIVFSWGGFLQDSYLLLNGVTKSDVVSIYGNQCKMYNHSGKSLFFPNKTLPEWLSVRKSAYVIGAVSIWCCGDGSQGLAGNGGNCDSADNMENCINCPSDCGACPTCTSFTYSDWSACSLGAQTRAVISSSPSLCTGGSPVLSQACNCGLTAGCATGYTCLSGNLFYSTTNCSGGSNPLSASCMPSGTVSGVCENLGTISRFLYGSGLCTYDKPCSGSPGHPTGCAVGSTCILSQVSNSSTNCSNLEVSTPICIPDAYIHLGCNVLETTRSYQHQTADPTSCSFFAP